MLQPNAERSVWHYSDQYGFAPFHVSHYRKYGDVQIYCHWKYGSCMQPGLSRPTWLNTPSFSLCDPNAPGGHYGRTPFHYAAQFGHLHIAKYLTDEQGCNPSCLDEHKYTPLHCAALKGHKHCKISCGREALWPNVSRFWTATLLFTYGSTRWPHRGSNLRWGTWSILYCWPKLWPKHSRSIWLYSSQLCCWMWSSAHIQSSDTQGCNPSCLDELKYNPLRSDRRWRIGMSNISKWPFVTALWSSVLLRLFLRP